MVKLIRSTSRWWQKPLASFEGQDLPAELVILRGELRERKLEYETGAWLNSRGFKTGAIDLVRDPDGNFKSVRMPLPDFVRAELREIYSKSGLSKGAPDLLLWNSDAETMLFIEVKCPHWDRLSPEQIKFQSTAVALGTKVAIVEWEFGQPLLAT